MQLRRRTAADLESDGAGLSQTGAVSEGPLGDPCMVRGMAGSGRLDEIAWNLRWSERWPPKCIFLGDYFKRDAIRPTYLPTAFYLTHYPGKL